MDALVCSPGFESVLAREIGTPTTRLVPGVVLADLGSREIHETDFVFARQILPDVHEVDADSIAALADGAIESTLPGLESSEAPWRLDTIVPDAPVDPNRPGELARRASLLESRILERLATRKRRVYRRRRTASPTREGVEPGAWVAQALLVSRRRLLASAAPVGQTTGLGAWPAPFPAGRWPIADDAAAPSSAYRKLLEALAWLGRDIHPAETVVDLGAAPGGWSHVALSRGASVVAVDRGELGPSVARHPRLVHVRRNDLGYRPAAGKPVDWLLCDAAILPARTLEVLETWVAEGLCRNLVVHLKFKGEPDLAAIARATSIVTAAGFARRRAKHLVHDRNEATLLASRDRVCHEP